MRHPRALFAKITRRPPGFDATAAGNFPATLFVGNDSLYAGTGLSQVPDQPDYPDQRD